MEGLFTMSNKNTLLALAYIRESDNPLRVLCNLISYCLSVSAEHTLMHNELKEKMTEEFGLNVPNHVIDSCIRYLKKDKNIEQVDNGGGYKLLKSKFDINVFNSDKSQLLREEQILLKELSDYVKANYGLDWDDDTSYRNLSELLLSEKTSVEIVEQTFSNNDDNKLKCIQPIWYVKKYITQLLERKKGASYQYFINVFNGILVLNGLTQTNDYNQDKMQKFKGTNFYFDTKLLLRILGFSFPYFCETSNELMQLIKNEYKGNICVFRHVIREIKYAIDLARNDLRTKGHIDNMEFDMFQRIHHYTSEDLEIAKDSVEKRLTSEFGFAIIDDIDWNKQSAVDYWINEEHLIKFIRNNNSKWSANAIKNDVRSIQQINIERKGQYSTRFGGKKKLPIFVTTNYKLVQDIKKYTAKNAHNANTSLPWDKNTIPIITENNLMCRLWLTSKFKDAITLNMAKSAYLYQQSDSAFYERIKSTYNEVKEKHQYNVIDLDYFRYEKLQDDIIKKTHGDLDKIDDNIVALSFEEMVKRTTIDKDRVIEALYTENDATSKRLEELQDDYIKSCAEKYINKIGLNNQIISKAITNLPLIVAIVGILATLIIDSVVSKSLISKGKLFILIPILCSVIFEIIDRKFLSESLIKKLSSNFVNHCKEEYCLKIQNKLSEKEKNYEKEIIKYSIDHTRFFNQ